MFRNILGCVVIMILALLSMGTSCPAPSASGPVADFDADVVSGLAPLAVEFTDMSDPGDSPITNWYWDFGDGESSTEQDPTHTYTEPGSYDVSLTVMTDDGVNTKTELDFITVTSGGDGETQTVMLPGGVPLVMVWIPGGMFMMGRNPGEQDSWSDEEPRHEVSVPGFWMAKYELTKRQWQAMMGTTPWSGFYVYEDLDSPAVYVSWTDAKSFITALNSYTGLAFRLPSEAEWEYACRAGTTTRFYWDNDPNYTLGNTYCWWAYNAWNVGKFYADVVGQKLPNAFGLYDMSGNVWEWCEDDWHDSYAAAPINGSAWVYNPRGAYRMLRGGSCYTNGTYCRSSQRFGGIPSLADKTFGFRLSR